MSDLLRGLAPITPASWSEIEQEAKRTLKVALAGRKLVDFDGPLGWDASAVSVGRVENLDESLGEGVTARRRRVQPLIELRAPFRLERAELDAIGRGAGDPDLGPVSEAARRIAAAEDKAVFYGYAAAGIVGICEGAPQPALEVTDDYTAYPRVVAVALSRLRQAGVDGPYAIALGRRCYTGLVETTTPAGYPVIQHVRRLIDGPIVWAPAIDGALVVSMRGGDYRLTVGQDLSIGYLAHDADGVHLYLQESFTFRALSPEAAVRLAYGESGRASGSARVRPG